MKQVKDHGKWQLPGKEFDSLRIQLNYGLMIEKKHFQILYVASSNDKELVLQSRCL